MSPTLAEAGSGPLGIAVSGGSDSLALLLLAERWAQAEGRKIRVVTVDHGLRHGSAAEAETVAELCRMRGLSHETLRWQRPDRSGNLQSNARSARRRLIADWAWTQNVSAVALGHTLDDQAETFLMRLARGSGVDGLSGMSPVSTVLGITWLRPMLDLRRDDLRAWLSGQGMCWAEDPSNSDMRFDRVRIRSAAADLARIGLTHRRLADTARRMQRARRALERSTQELAATCARLGPCGDVSLECRSFSQAPEEIRTRLLAAILCWVGGHDYRPRFEALSQLEQAIVAGAVGGGKTLHGCVLRQRGGQTLIRREPIRPSAPVSAAQRIWDRRWCLEGDAERAQELVIGALGEEGLSRIEDWRRIGAAREALITTPALWRHSELIAAPLAGQGNGFSFRLRGLPAELSGLSQLD
ncbi:tRNA lysidine(34) synthetase TilS [Amaricoccus macauensis]|uniref:tRNA lysidine(34) synthetase TilS n=1 Tax=Amaricoccus macauensis TaxID=57001 RepID=UPI003C7BC076